jgi:hypothetical protein
VIGIAAVLVQAKDDVAKAWYLRQAEFMAFPGGWEGAVVAGGHGGRSGGWWVR